MLLLYFYVKLIIFWKNSEVLWIFSKKVENFVKNRSKKGSKNRVKSRLFWGFFEVLAKNPEKSEKPEKGKNGQKRPKIAFLGSTGLEPKRVFSYMKSDPFGGLGVSILGRFVNRFTQYLVRARGFRFSRSGKNFGAGKTVFQSKTRVWDPPNRPIFEPVFLKILTFFLFSSINFYKIIFVACFYNFFIKVYRSYQNFLKTTPTRKSPPPPSTRFMPEVRAKPKSQFVGCEP